MVERLKKVFKKRENKVKDPTTATVSMRERLEKV